MLVDLIKGLLSRRRTEAAELQSDARIEPLLRKFLVGFLNDAPKPIGAIDYELVAHLRAAHEAAEYMNTHMTGAQNHRHRQPLLLAALAHCEVPGLMLEFGVFMGHSLRFLAQHTNEIVHGFDSFQGLPEDWTHFQRKGRYDVGGQVPEFSEANIRVHAGWFSDSLPPFLAQESGLVRFLHLDCDLYSSTREVLEALASRIVKGTVIVFDDYLNYPAWRQHQYRAFQEFVAARGFEYRYLGFASSYTAVTVCIT